MRKVRYGAMRYDTVIRCDKVQVVRCDKVRNVRRDTVQKSGAIRCIKYFAIGRYGTVETVVQYGTKE